MGIVGCIFLTPDIEVEVKCFNSLLRCNTKYPHSDGNPRAETLSFTPVLAMAPGTRSTPFTNICRNPIPKEEGSSFEKKPQLNLRWLESGEIPKSSIISLFSLFTSLIEVALPYVDDSPSAEAPLQKPTEVKPKPVNISANGPHILHQWIEPLTYRRDITFILSQRTELTNPIVKLLIATENLDIQDLL